MRRIRTPFRSLLLLPFAAALAAAPLAAKDSYPLEITVKNEAGELIQDAAVEVTVQSGEPFTASGKSDKKGRFKAKLPDFGRVYEFKVTKAPYAPFEQEVDFAAQHLVPGGTAEITVTLLEERGPSAETIFNEGVAAIRANDLATAEAKMKAAVALKPELGQAWSVLAMLAAEKRNWSEALDAADKTLALLPGDVAALRARPDALTGLGRKEEAEAALDQLAMADKTPDGARILFNAGAGAWSAKDGALATRRFEQALAADPKLYQAHAALAEVKIDAKDLEGALAALDRAIEIAPTQAKLWRRKVAVLEALGRTADADAAKRKLAELGG